jgi:topoisomerase IA-like protein
MTKKGPLLLIETANQPTVFLGWPDGIAFEAITEADIAAFRAAKAPIGEWNGLPITQHTGKFGTYLSAGDWKIPHIPAEPLADTIARFEAKQAAPAPIAFKNYSIRTGPHGPYIMKTSLKTPQFVSLPKGLDPASVKTEKEVEALFKAGMAAKAKGGKPISEKSGGKPRGKNAAKE